MLRTHRKNDGRQVYRTIPANHLGPVYSEKVGIFVFVNTLAAIQNKEFKTTIEKAA